MKTPLTLATVCYVLMVIFTFGNALNYFNRTDNQAGKAFLPFVALGWPFYWSCWLQETETEVEK